jgi:uncharacterized membrane protein (UPF0127 family)
MRAATTLILAVLGIAECQKPQGENLGAAPGPVASASVAAASTVEAYQPPRPASPPLATSRCVSVTPAEAPRAVPPGPDPRCPADPEPPGATPLPVSDVRFSDVGGVEVRAEVVRSEQETSRGLMYRKKLAEERGMLFDLRVRGEHAFWMHNTCIPLDMIFIDEDGLIVGIVENAPTLDDDTRDVGCPSRWVLEVNAGWSRRHGIRAGQHVSL